MLKSSNIFVANRSLGYVSNGLPLQVRYIKCRNEYLIVTCVGRAFHTYGGNHFNLLSVSGQHAADITCLAADTFHVYTACQNTVFAWRRGNELKHRYVGHTKRVHLMLPFGPHLVSVDDANVVKVWDIKAETLTLELCFTNDTFKISAILHPNAYVNKILLASEQGSLQLWNLNSSQLVYNFKGWDAAVTCLSQAPANDVIAIGLANGRILLHNLRYDETVMEFLQDWGMVTAISFRLDNNPIMVSGSVQGHLVFWNLDEQRMTNQITQAHTESVTGLVFLPCEPLLLSTSPDNTLKMWIFDKSDGGGRLLRIREGHAAAPTMIRFYGTNGANILSASDDSTLRIFNTHSEHFNRSLGRATMNRKASKRKKRQSLQAPDPLILPSIVHFASETTREKDWNNIAALHQGTPIVTLWSYSKCKIGDIKLVPDRFKKRHIVSDLAVCASSLYLTHCGNFAVIGYNTGHVDRFNVQSGLWRYSYGDPVAHQSPVRGVVCDDLNRLVVTGSGDSTLCFWPFKGGVENRCRTPLKRLHLSESVSFLRAHRHSCMLVAVVLDDYTVIIVDILLQSVVRKLFGHKASITDATFSPDGRWLLTSSIDGSIRVWDIPSNQLVDQFATVSPCVSLTFSPTGEFLATAHVDHLGVFIWTNCAVFNKIALSALDPESEPQLISLPDNDTVLPLTTTSAAHIQDTDGGGTELVLAGLNSDQLVLSGLSVARWGNLLDIDTIRKRNKPIEELKVMKNAPFFLPTISTLSDFQFDLNSSSTVATDPLFSSSKVLTPVSDSNLSLITLSEFGRALDKCRTTTTTTGSVAEAFSTAFTILKTYGPSTINFEIHSLAPECCGSVDLMVQFLRMIESVLQSNRDFDLAVAYLAVFLKEHGPTIISEPVLLQPYVKSVSECHDKRWHLLQKKCFYIKCVVQNLK